LAIVLAVGATSFAAEKTIVDNLTDVSMLHSYDSTLLETEWSNDKWLLADTRALIPQAVGKIPVITYKLNGEITGFSIDTVYAKFAVNGVEQWATAFTFEVSANGEDWTPIAAERTDGTEKNPGGGAVVKEVDYSASNINAGNYYLRITFGDNTAVTKRWAVALDTVTISYEEVYTFTDGMKDYTNLYDSTRQCEEGSRESSVAASENPVVIKNDEDWPWEDGGGMIPLNVGSVPYVVYKFDDEIKSFDVETVFAKYANKYATDFIFEVSSNGTAWTTIEDVSKNEGKEKKTNTSNTVVKEVDYSASNIGAGNYYLKITFGNNTEVNKRWAVALDTVKVTCALGENTLTMANGESGTIYCSESTDSSKVTATIVAKDTSSKSAIAILATYDSANKLVNVQTKDVAFNTTEDLSCERLILPVANSAKLMILNSLGTLVPMTQVNPIQ